MIQRLVVVLSENAISDLEAIGSYILEASGSENVANGFVDRIRERCQSIGNAPRGGRSRDDISLGLRTVPFEHSAVIAYAIEGDARSHREHLLRRARLRNVDAGWRIGRPILKRSYSAGSGPAIGNPGLPASPGFLLT